MRRALRIHSKWDFVQIMRLKRHRRNRYRYQQGKSILQWGQEISHQCLWHSLYVVASISCLTLQHSLGYVKCRYGLLRTAPLTSMYGLLNHSPQRHNANRTLLLSKAPQTFLMSLGEISHYHNLPSQCSKAFVLLLSQWVLFFYQYYKTAWTYPMWGNLKP